MVAPILIPFVILGGMDGVEPLCASASLREIKISSVQKEREQYIKKELEMKEKEIVIRRETSWKGISAAAQRLGVSRPHLSMVLSGQRESRRLREAMRRRHIRVEGVELVKSE